MKLTEQQITNILQQIEEVDKNFDLGAEEVAHKDFKVKVNKDFILGIRIYKCNFSWRKNREIETSYAASLRNKSGKYRMIGNWDIDTLEDLIRTIELAYSITFSPDYEGYRHMAYAQVQCPSVTPLRTDF